MKKINLIVMILLSMLAAYLFYGLIRESWTKIDDVLLIVLLAGGMINSTVVGRNRKRNRKAESTRASEESHNKD